MLSRETVSAFRFGFGLSPRDAPPVSPETLLGSLSLPAHGQAAPWPERRRVHDLRAEANRAVRNATMHADNLRKAATKAVQGLTRADQRLILMRPLAPGSGFRERLVHFWADHFTVVANNQLALIRRMDFSETAIRPHVAGRFSDMLSAVAFHPSMLAYLDQAQSAGPNSRAGQRRGRGLNENFAREMLELHTLGVDGQYAQTDVQQLAELLTGLSMDKDGFRLRQNLVEPGAETVLGRRYGGPGTDAEQAIRRALQDMAAHPDTARHLARKLLIHFLGVHPPEDLVAKMATAYLRADTDLTAAYRVMLEDERAWQAPFTKVRPPIEFMIASLRAAGATPAHLAARTDREIHAFFLRPLAGMGQPLWRPNGPDGWPEAPSAWITPATLATRLRWAMRFAEEVLAERDPRAFLETALADAASPTLRFAVAGAERRAEGAALVLASPEFNRR